MRLLSLDLERYGPFTGRRVDFRADARLHVVLGANEAGKSSALAAVTDLLFGIGTRTAYAFLHEMPQLRIGAEIGSADGRTLCFRRRKGNRNTLVDADDAPLPETVLAPFLGGLTREVFCRAFGLDANSLREGAREMLLAEGELGASLFAAASGLRGYSDLQKSLEAESDRIYGPRKRQDRSFYQAFDRYEDARKAIRDTGLRAGDWRDLNDSIATAGNALDAIKAERMRIAAEQARLTRLRRVGPLLAEIDGLAARDDAEPGLVEVPDAWVDRLGEACAALRARQADAARIDAAADAARAAFAAVAVDAGLVGRAEEILEGFRGIDRFDKNGVDLPRIQGEADQFDAELARLAVRVGLPDVEALTRRQPSDAVRARVETLIRDGQEDAAAIARLERDLAAARTEHEGLLRDVAEGGTPVDPAPFRETLRPLAAIRGVIAERDALDATVRRAEQVLRGQAARLSPAVADVAALAAAPLPTVETVTRFRALLDGKERERVLAVERRDSARRQVATRRGRLREREAGRPIATLSDLSALRAERDAAFAPLREALSEGVRRAPGDIAAYERLAQAADRLADDLAADAARVAEHAADRLRLDAELVEAEAADAILAEIEAEVAEGHAAWVDLWRPAGIAPSTPAEMTAWLGEAETLIEGKGDLDERHIDRALRTERIEAARAPLLDMADRMGLTDLAGLDVGLILGRLEERVAAIASRWEATREANARIGAAAIGIARSTTALADAKAKQAAWRNAWDDAVRAIGLDGAAGTEMATSALAAWQAVPNALAERENRRARVAGIRRDMEAYHAAVTPLIAALAPDLAHIQPSAAIRSLQTRLQEAQASETRRRELAKRRDEAEREAGAAMRARDDALGHLAGLLADTVPDLGADAQDAVEALHGRLVARRALRAEALARRVELARAADGVPEDALRADLAAIDADAIEARLRSLAMEDEDLDQRGKTAFAERDRSERRREALEGGTGAELALAQKKAAEAELHASARQWAVLKLASLMLGTAIARQRTGQQDPLLTRAGAIMAALTGGGFSGLAQDYDEADKALIVARRAGGETVHVQGLSEGTRDQLYLALRLAYLEDYAGKAEPAPFIGDDLFSTFDDARTGHGLEALAAIGGTVQPILFTHHRHVADLAQARLGSAVDIIPL
ncbi:AAA family ATPase [Methylobacterium sp. E-016]|uniref:ATP-binding protein n=1 Tax=Methylobacterium sp. E-016 TaxID=2836556 RepID=UPI001FBBD747|nr:YhaN family protein [Methylobacterium sp. E-016]MCJ2075708.1 AAA family ATPase [Methylobacterium sp. E-016]